MLNRAQDDRRLSAVTGAGFFCIFCVIGAILSVFLTILKFRSAVQCDEALLSACQLGSWFDCNSVLNSPWSAAFGIPISVYSTAFYACGIWLSARLLRDPDENLPSARPLVLALAWIGLIVVAPLAWYAVFTIGSFCTFCVMIYIVNVALFLAACLINPDGARGGLRGLLVRGLPRRTFTVCTLLLLFSAVLAVQVAAYLRGAMAMEVETRCIKPGGRLPAPALMVPAEQPEAEIALFIDFACSACRAEYSQWRADVTAAAGRYRLSLYHFPREGECLPGGTSFNPNSAYHHSCRAAAALECFSRMRPEAGWAMADALFAAHDSGGGPWFTVTRLAEIATASGLPVDLADRADPFVACMESDESVLRRIHEHAKFGLDRDLTETPGTFFLFFHPDGRPFEKIHLVKGDKSYPNIDEYIEHARQKVLDEIEDAPVAL